MNVFKPRGLCNVLLLVPRSRILHGEVSRSRLGTVSSCPRFAGVEMRRKRAEKLAFLRGFYMPGTIFEGLNWDNRWEAPFFLEGKVKTQRFPCPRVTQQINVKFKPKSVSGKKKKSLK